MLAQQQQTEVYGHLEGLDIAVIAVYLLLSVGIGVAFARRGTKNTEAYFVGGRGMPWWLVGFGLAATCFAADTPLWIGEIVYKRGLEATWLHWCTGIGFSFYVFVIAPLWRRSRLITDLEFLELRYSGKAATAMRGINSVYYSLFFNVMMMGVSTLSITTVMQATTGLDKGYCVLITMGGALIYCTISGLWGVAATDFMQFFVTFLGSAVLAGFALHAVGGADELVAFLHGQENWAGRDLNIMPDPTTSYGLPLMTILFIFTYRWLDNASIGGYVSQRLFAARTTKHATMGAMLHSLIYWSIVPLPWIITIAAARMYMPDMEVGKEAYPRMAMAVLPIGVKGLLVASMLAAFMSTYSSLLSWGSSYAVNDFYRRFLVRSASPTHYVRVGQLFMTPMALISAFIAYKAESIFGLLAYLFLFPAALWSVQLARWLWWRVNAWAELGAMIGGVAMVLGIVAFRRHWLHPDHVEQFFGASYFTVALGSLVVWLAVMFLTTPTSRERLDAFVRRVNPPGLWGPVRHRVGGVPALSWGGVFASWGTMLLAIYGPLVGLVKLVFGPRWQGMVALALGIVGIALAVRRARRMQDDDREVEEAELEPAGEPVPVPVGR